MVRLRAAIRAISSYLPADKLTNEQLAQQLGDWDAAKIWQKTGISTRSVAASEECASDLGVAAARQLFESGVCAPADIDFLLFCTQSPDYFLPSTGCIIQDRLGLRTNCGALDFNLGCSGFVYGLALAKSLIETGIAGHVLLITAETYTKFINCRDRSTRTIFGDGAAATLISPICTDTELIGPFVFGTDGSGANHLIVPAGGLRQRPIPETAIEREAEGGNWRSAQNLLMNGPEIFNFTLRVVPSTIDLLLKRASLSMEQVDCFVFHQASKFMLDHLRSKLKIPAEKFYVCLEECGNTVSATIPIAIEHAQNEGRIKSGDRVMLVGFGVGLSWGAAMTEMI